MFKGKEYIYEVYKTRSFSKAADNLYISQPALSATIKKIETRIGAPLFDRSNTPIQLTDVGQKYIHYIEHIIDIEAEFESYLNDQNALKTGHLSIGGSNLFASYILPPILKIFMDRYPQVEVKLIESNTKHLESLLLSGNIDLFIDNSAFPSSVFEKQLFREEHLLLAVPVSFCNNQTTTATPLTHQDICHGKHLKKTIKPIDLTVFKEYPFLLLRSGNDTRKRSDKLFETAGLKPKIALKLDQQATAYHIACGQMGITFVTDTLIENIPIDDRVVFFTLPAPESLRSIYFYHKRNRYLTRAMEVFLGILRA